MSGSSRSRDSSIGGEIKLRFRDFWSLCDRFAANFRKEFMWRGFCWSVNTPTGNFFISDFCQSLTGNSDIVDHLAGFDLPEIDLHTGRPTKES